MAYLEAQHVSHIYESKQGPVEALKNIDLSVSKGEITCILGPSGCGKSTLLHILAGLTDPTKGDIQIDDTVVEGIPENLGVIFQDFDSTLLKWKSVYENVALGAELRGNGDVESITEKYLELTGLSEFKHSKPHGLSGGMKQRVQVARVLAYDPQLLLCDEPFGALDLQTKEALQDEFLQILEDKSVGTVFVTHDIEEAIYLSDVIHIFTTLNPGTIGKKVEIDFERPRYPKREFETKYSEELIDKKNKLREMIRQ